MDAPVHYAADGANDKYEKRKAQKWSSVRLSEALESKGQPLSLTIAVLESG